MNEFLLDTHSFVWWDGDPSRLSPRARATCFDPANRLRLSVASIWELQIKLQLGRLTLHCPLPDIVRDQLATNRGRLLHVTPEHIFALGQLPPAHRDPFDRMLAAQANFEAISLISRDPIFAHYPVTVIW